MDIILYQYKGRKNVINKKLEYLETLKCKVTDKVEYSTLSVFITKRDGDFNYCYIPKLKRYYYVNNYTFNPHGVLKMDLEIDVLTTFKNSIMNSECIISTVENVNPYADSSEVYYDVRKEVTKYSSDVTLERNDSNVMIVISDVESEV